MTLSRQRARLYASLRWRKRREREGRFLAEGVRVVREAVRGAGRVECVILSGDAGPDARDVAGRAEEEGIEVHRVDAATIRSVTATTTPQGIAAVLLRSPVGWDEVIRREGDLLFLDAVQDPGNLGTLIRCARAFGMGGVGIGKGCADPFEPKAVRAGAGAHFGIPVSGPLDGGDALALARGAGCSVVTADAREGVGFEEAAYPPRVVLVLGNEARGVDPGIAAGADIRVRIPLMDGADSLNVAVASGILLHEIARRRPDRARSP